MGITKQQLKSIVKECLIEILSEGMGSTTAESINEVKRKNPQKQSMSTADVLRQNASKIKVQSAALKEAIKIEAGGNDIMASILADTAEKTLPAMLENDRMRRPAPAGNIENIVASHNPDELFGSDATSKWVDLAFMDARKK